MMKKTIMATVTTMENIHMHCAAYLIALSADPRVQIILTRGRPVDYARNQAVRVMLSHPEFTHLFMIDSDMELRDDSLDKLLALDAPIATGCYPALMGADLLWALGQKSADGHYYLLEWFDDASVPFEVDCGGAGCLLIKREVFEKTPWPWFSWQEDRNGKQISEDIYFFMQCNKFGYRAKVEPKVFCKHFKETDILPLMRANNLYRMECARKEGVTANYQSYEATVIKQEAMKKANEDKTS